MRELTGRRPATTPTPEPLPLLDWLVAFIDADPAPRDALDSLPGMLHHLTDAWTRRHEPNVVLVHYEDLIADLDGEMRRIAACLDIDIDIADAAWPELVHAARFDQMQARATELAPDPADILHDRARFFRRGSSGAGRELLTAEPTES